LVLVNHLKLGRGEEGDGNVRKDGIWC